MIKKDASILLFFIFLSVALFGQKTQDNLFIINQAGKFYNFEIINNSFSCSIKCLKFEGNDSVDSIAISSINDKQAVIDAIAAFKQNKRTATPSNDDITIIAEKLILLFNERQRAIEFKEKLAAFNNDNFINIGELSLKATKVTAYLIPRKQAQKRIYRWCGNIDIFKIEKKEKRRDIQNILSDAKAVPISIESMDVAFEGGIIKDVLVRAQFIPEKPVLIPVVFFELVFVSPPPIRVPFIAPIVPPTYWVSPRIIFVQSKPKEQVKNKLFKLSNLGYLPVRNAIDIDNLLSSQKNYLSFWYSKDSVLVVDLADVMHYNRIINYGSGNYIPVDTVIKLTSEKNEKVKLNKPPISESFDIRIYTDAMAYGASAAPNGLVQAEAQLDINLSQGRNRFSLFKIWKLRGQRVCRSQFLLMNKLVPYIRFSKIENSNSVMPVNGEGKGNYLDVFRYANINVGTDINITTARTDSKLFTTNAAIGILRTTLGNDSIASHFYTISTMYLNPTFEFRFFESNKIDFAARAGMFYAWRFSLLEKSALKKAKINEDFDFPSENLWGQVQQTINLHPRGNKQSSIFIRSSQYFNKEKNFFTFQIGYSTSLSNLFKF